MKSLIKQILIIAFFSLFCFSFIVFRFFYPYHKLIAFILFISFWIFYLYPHFLRIKVKGSNKRLRKDKHYKFLISHKYKFLILLVVSILIYNFTFFFPTDNFDLLRQDRLELNTQLDSDYEYLEPVILAFDNDLTYLIDSGLLSLTIETTDPEKEEDLRQSFRKIIDYIFIFDRYSETYQYFYQINPHNHNELHLKAFLLFYSSYLHKNYAIHEINQNIKSEYVLTILNEEYYGLNYLFSRFLQEHQNVRNLARLHLSNFYLQTHDNFLNNSNLNLITMNNKVYDNSFSDYDYDTTFIINNALDRFEQDNMASWLPVQKNIANFFGDTKIYKHNQNYIKTDQVTDIIPLLEPGDILFQRRNWYISNAAMPGFWTHSLLYLGSLDELDNYFSNETSTLYNTTFSSYLESEYPLIYQEIQNHPGKFPLRTIESNSVGVRMLSLQESATSDYLAVIRPRLSKSDKLNSLLFALEQLGKPYDYNFDFRSDDSYVCSELVYKSYQPTTQKSGLDYDLGLVSGRWMISPNAMVQTFYKNYQTSNQQNDFILFLDGNSTTNTATFKPIESFLLSWNRSKYDWQLD